MNVFACPGCGKEYNNRPEYAGKTLKCKACGQPMKLAFFDAPDDPQDPDPHESTELPFDTSVPPVEVEAKAPAAPNVWGRRAIEYMSYIGAAFVWCIFLMVCTLPPEESGWIDKPILLLAVTWTVYLWTDGIMLAFPGFEPLRWKVIITGLAIGVIANLAWLPLDRFERSYINDSGSLVRDEHYAWGNRLYYRCIFLDGKGTLACGPMEGSPPAMHGHWELEFDGRIVAHYWYWYGEEVSQGEWQLRKSR